MTSDWRERVEHRPSRLLDAARALPWSADAVALTAIMTLLFLGIVLIEPTPRPFALLAAGVAALSVDGILRAARPAPFREGRDTTPFLFLPALYALALPVFIEHNVRGYWVLPAALLAGAGFGAVALAQVASVLRSDPARELARAIGALASYVLTFALLSLTYTFELGPWAAAFAVGLIALLASVDMLRDAEADPIETLVLAAVTGGLLMQARIVLHYVPLGGHLAALALMFVFYLVTGVLHSHLTRHLDLPMTVQYALVAAAGIALVSFARAAGLG